MPERLDRVLVAYSRGTVELRWDVSDQLIAELRGLDSAKSIIAKFEAVGASRPVAFTEREKRVLIEAINLGSQNCTLGAVGLPSGVWELRNALIDELHDTAGDR